MKWRAFAPLRGSGLLNESTSLVEFATKDVDKTMATMVQEPYVNHIPTVTGGIGYKDLHRFYRDYFIPGAFSSQVYSSHATK